MKRKGINTVEQIEEMFSSGSDFDLSDERKKLFKWLSEQLGKSNAILICGKIKAQDKEFIRRAKKEIKEKLRKLGVRISEEDKFDMIGVENAIYSSIAEIDKIAGEELSK